MLANKNLCERSAVILPIYLKGIKFRGNREN